MVGREVPEDDVDCGTFSTGPNLWPSSLPKARFQDHIMEYQGRMLKLVKTLLTILALGLPKEWGCSADVFDSLLDKASIPMRFLHYAPVSDPDPLKFGGKLLPLVNDCHVPCPHCVNTNLPPSY